jgi:threonine/homoserine/homoserine lactone efflux protein
MDALPFALGAIALLATPGPTNSLLAASGALAGVRRSLRLLPCELGGYLLAIGLFHEVLMPWLSAWAVTALKLIAIGLLIGIAIRLWRASGRAGAQQATDGRTVFVATVLNPKALIFATLLFPADAFLRPALLFAPLCLGAGLSWIVIGARLGRLPLLDRTAIYRSTALAQTAFATIAAVALFRS